MSACTVGEHVTVGHGAIIHGCTVEDGALIGMGATILDQAVVGKESVVGAQSLVSLNKTIPPRSLAVGIPAKVVREVSDEDYESIRDNCMHYVDFGKKYREIFPH